MYDIASECEACGAGVGTEVAFDEVWQRHYFCELCSDNGNAITHLERLAG